MIDAIITNGVRASGAVFACNFIILGFQLIVQCVGIQTIKSQKKLIITGSYLGKKHHIRGYSISM